MISYAALAAIEARAANRNTPAAILRDDLKLLTGVAHELLWRHTAAELALSGRATGSHFAAEVDAALERARVST